MPRSRSRAARPPISRAEADRSAAGLLARASEELASRGVADARASAELLLAHALGTDREGLYRRFGRPLDAPQRERFRGLVEARGAGTPVAYLTGRREFYSLPFFVDPGVLIPRPETELLVDEVLACFAAGSRGRLRVLDVGTGSGAVGVALKKKLPRAFVVGVDASPAALALARRNASANDASLFWICGDLLSAVRGGADAVVANLPYVAREEIASLPPEVRDFEPRRALDGGRGGLELVDRLIRDVAARFPAAKLFLEIGAGQDGAVAALLAREGWAVKSVRNDLAGIPRVVAAEREAECR